MTIERRLQQLEARMKPTEAIVPIRQQMLMLATGKYTLSGDSPNPVPINPVEAQQSDHEM
ncbi:hypothetical protein HY524_00390 [Candidatus Berkelbacteria bacterium]|nr:hypothetical protein [Candidatus Berkelbacteria bacterium]